MANCENDGHVYRSMSTKCIFCGYEPTNLAQCETRCAEYQSGECRCARMERLPGHIAVPGERAVETN